MTWRRTEPGLVGWLAELPHRVLPERSYPDRQARRPSSDALGDGGNTLNEVKTEGEHGWRCPAALTQLFVHWTMRYTT